DRRDEAVRRARDVSGFVPSGTRAEGARSSAEAAAGDSGCGAGGDANVRAVLRLSGRLQRDRKQDVDGIARFEDGCGEADARGNYRDGKSGMYFAVARRSGDAKNRSRSFARR